MKSRLSVLVEMFTQTYRAGNMEPRSSNIGLDKFVRVEIPLLVYCSTTFIYKLVNVGDALWAFIHVIYMYIK